MYDKVKTQPAVHFVKGAPYLFQHLSFGLLCGSLMATQVGEQTL